MPSITSYDRMLRAAAAVGPVPVAIAAAQESQLLVAAHEAYALGIARPLLVGDAQEIGKLAAQQQLDVSTLQVVDLPDPTAAADHVMRIVAQGTARVAIKGQMQTSRFLHAALRRDAGLRTGQLVTHVGLFEVPDLDRLLFITDGGVVLQPTRDQKVEIVSNAILAAHALGIEEPRVALVAAADHVRPELPATVEVAEVVALQERWRDEGAWVDGPFQLDTAMSTRIAQQKGRAGRVAGRADVLVGPDVESVNIMAKGITYFAGGRMAGLVLGARAPLVVGSRADPPYTRLVCMAAGVLFASWVDAQALSSP